MVKCTYGMEEGPRCVRLVSLHVRVCLRLWREPSASNHRGFWHRGRRRWTECWPQPSYHLRTHVSQQNLRRPREKGDGPLNMRSKLVRRVEEVAGQAMRLLRESAVVP